MKKFALLGICLASSLAFAAEKDTEACNELADLAAAVMQQRQDDVPLETQERIALEFEDESKALYEEIVQASYGQPVYRTDLAKEQSVEKIRKQYFELCMAAE
ncbi:hypothetical protein [Acinetobacter sp.]|uniref:hypothetical protein n=1 Tax=Acinetobacter sp. TaxID=472 RepID=UPI002FCB6F1C